MRSRDDRDRAVERLMRRPLAPRAAAPASSCIDAETLAAWSDGTLPATHASAVEVHLSTCGDCQLLAATFARSLPPAPARRPLFERWQFRWLVPLAAAATAVALWVAVPERSGPVSNLALEERAVTRDVPSKAPTALSRDVQPQPPAGVTSDQPIPAAPAPSSRRDLSAPQPSVEGAKRADSQEARRNAEALAALAERLQVAPDSSAVGAAVPAPSAPTQPVEAPPTRQLPAPQKSEEADRLGTTSDRLAAPRPAAKANLDADARANAVDRTELREEQVRQRSSVGRNLRDARVSGTVQWSSPDRSVRWRITPEGRVERSAAESASWEVVAAGREGSLTVGAAPSPTVCWLVGRAGMVLRTTDGRRFDRVSFPSPSDLVAVESRDANVATVTSADGRSYTTSDGGVTWKSAN